MAEGVCLECGAEMTYDWAPCPHCGWKAPEPWETEEDSTPSLEASPGILLKPQSWIALTVWILLGLLLMGLVFFLWRHS